MKEHHNIIVVEKGFGVEHYYQENLLASVANPAWDASGLFLIHDLVDHVNGLGKIGTLHDELEALGCMLYREPTRSMDIFTVSLESNILMILKKRNAPYDRPVVPKNLPSFSDYVEKHNTGLINSLGKESDDVVTYIHEALYLVRVGYNKAKNMYGSQQRLQKFHDSVWSTIEGTVMKPGSVYRLTVDREELTSSIVEI